MRDCLVGLAGKAWRILWKDEVDNGDSDGHCDESHSTGPRILINRTLPFSDRLETLIHEIEHAQNPWMSEDAVTQRAKEKTDAIMLSGILEDMDE